MSTDGSILSHSQKILFLFMITGQGTLGVEILEQLPNLDYLFIAVGGGGLIAGVAAYIKMMRPQVVIVGCQPEASPVMSKVRYQMSYLTLFIVGEGVFSDPPRDNCNISLPL